VSPHPGNFVDLLWNTFLLIPVTRFCKFCLYRLQDFANFAYTGYKILQILLIPVTRLNAVVNDSEQMCIWGNLLDPKCVIFTRLTKSCRSADKVQSNFVDFSVMTWCSLFHVLDFIAGLHLRN